MANHVDQNELDQALLALTETIDGLRESLICRAGDTERDYFEKMTKANRQVNEIAAEVRIIFVELLERCVDSKNHIPRPTIEWSRDDYGNLRRDHNIKPNPPCEICGEIRAIEICHIIPSHLGGSKGETNTLHLCAKHHICFDHGILSQEEWDTIDWRGKSNQSKTYAVEVMLERQKLFWAGGKVPPNMTYHSFPPLTEWIKKHTGKNSPDEWNRKRRNSLVKKSGKGILGN
tara:strand:- start:897 stop:1592 length:696 start_codon:yes stop_codon:yes gene_type:complete